MITAVDTNVLLDVFLPDKTFAEESAKWLKLAYNEGALLISDIVYAELVPQFWKRSLLDDTLATLNITVSPGNADIAFLAGEKWTMYRRSGGKRERIITDFLIGAHAMMMAERFITRDRGFYRSYFPDLKLLGS